MKKPRVLMLAENANPLTPSLPIVAYKAIVALSEYAEVTVATHIRNKPSVDEAGYGKAEVEYFDNEYIASTMWRLGNFLRGGDDVGWTTSIAMNYLPYIVFEYQVWKFYADKLRSGGFDIVQRITPMSPTLPSPIAKWSPVPFVLGPLNGAVNSSQRSAHSSKQGALGSGGSISSVTGSTITLRPYGSGPRYQSGIFGG